MKYVLLNFYSFVKFSARKRERYNVFNTGKVTVFFSGIISEEMTVQILSVFFT